MIVNVTTPHKRSTLRYRSTFNTEQSPYHIVCYKRPYNANEKHNDLMYIQNERKKIWYTATNDNNWIASSWLNTFALSERSIKRACLSNTMAFSVGIVLLCPNYRHYIFWSVRSSVRLSRLRLKFLVKVEVDEVEV